MSHGPKGGMRVSPKSEETAVKHTRNEDETTGIGRTEELARDMAYEDFMSHHPDELMALEYEEQAWVHYETEAQERIIDEDPDHGMMSEEELNDYEC